MTGSVISEFNANLMLFPIGIVGLLFGLYQILYLRNIDISKEHQNKANQAEASKEKFNFRPIDEEKGTEIELTEHTTESIENKVKKKSLEFIDSKGNRIYPVQEIVDLIDKGARDFLWAEYQYCAVFMVLMSLLLAVSAEEELGQFWTTIAFVAGATTSIIAGYIGMRVAVFANGRVALQTKRSLADGFVTAFKAGSVMGFCLTSLGLLVLLLLLLAYNAIYSDLDVAGPTEYYKNFVQMYESIAGYGLGGSSIALFGRVGGGIYTKAADVGADLVGKVEEHMKEDSPKNPGTIADNVGDNVGDVAGMGADLFGSFAESSSATLVVASNIHTFKLPQNRGAMYFPVAITAFGIVVCLLTSFLATNFNCLEGKGEIEVQSKEDKKKAEEKKAADIKKFGVPNVRQWFKDCQGDNWDDELTGIHTEFQKIKEELSFDAIDKHIQDNKEIIANAFNNDDTKVKKFVQKMVDNLGFGEGETLEEPKEEGKLPADTLDSVESELKRQLLVSTLLMTPAIYLACIWFLPKEWQIKKDSTKKYQRIAAFYSVAAGLWGGLGIGYITEYYTSYQNYPTQEVSESCETGAATNIIYGLALGYVSCILPVIILAIIAYGTHKQLDMFGIGLAALGMLSTLSVGLTIDAYGPISDNAGGIAEMCFLGDNVRERTDALDSAGNTTAAIGKGFAIGSAALVGMALFGAFITRTQNTPNLTYPLCDKAIKITDPLIFSGLIIGAMLPYAFSAMTMKSVGKAALEMVQEIRDQIKNKPGIMDGSQPPDYAKCIEISTKASLNEMIPPGILVMGTPIILGILFGPKAVAGLLPGCIVSGIQMAISASNTGGSWDNAKKYVEAGLLTLKKREKIKINPEGSECIEIECLLRPGKGSEVHCAAVIGDTVGDPLKDTSGPSLNILIKLSAIISLVFAQVFDLGLLAKYMNEDTKTLCAKGK